MTLLKIFVGTQMFLEPCKKDEEKTIEILSQQYPQFAGNPEICRLVDSVTTYDMCIKNYIKEQLSEQ